MVYLFKLFPYALDVGYNNGDVLVIFVAAVAVCIGRVPVGNRVLVVFVLSNKFLLKLI